MKNFWEKLRKSKGFWLGLIIILQTVVYVICGINKAYIHMDEGYSYGLTNYDQVEMVDAPDFYDHWHSGEYYEDYLAVQEDEKWNFAPVYNNQRDDVHPPLYYLLLRLAMEFSGDGHYSKWPGLILNMIVMAANTVFVFLVAEKLLRKEKYGLQKALVLTLCAGLTVAALDTMLYIRMYALLTLMVTVTAWLHLKLLEAKKIQPKLLVAIGVVALLGVLTQYYYLFFLVPLYIYLAIRYARAKRWKELGLYTGALAIAAVLSLVIWPYSIKHMFFGYRGQGVLESLMDGSSLVLHLGIYLWLLGQYAFNEILPGILIAVLVMGVVGMIRGKKIEAERSERTAFSMILVATLTYFVIAAVASPYQDLRYIMAICGMSFVLGIFGIYKVVGAFWREKVRNVIMMILLVIMLFLPFVTRNYPPMMYPERAEIVAEIEAKHEAPAIYFMDTSDQRFLDDILLFTMLDESYVAKDMTVTEEKVREILRGKDLTKGLIVFINNGQDNEKILETVDMATGLGEAEWLSGLFGANVYYFGR